MARTDVYTYTSNNISDLMCELLGEHYQKGPLPDLISNPLLTHVECIDGGRIHASRVRPDALLSVCDGYRFLGHERPKYDVGALFALCEQSYGAWTLAVHPEPTARLSDLAWRWLSEPMPETWLLALSQHTGSSSDYVSVSKLEPDTFGPQNLALPPSDANSRYTCYGTVRVCEAGSTRLDFLWQAERFYRIRKLNPFYERNAYPISSTPGILFKGEDRFVVFVWDIDRRRRGSDRYLNGRWSVVRNLYADYLALMSTVAGFTDLQLQDIAALAGTWWLSSVLVAPMLSSSASRRTSLLLTTDMFGRLSPDMRHLLIPLLRAWESYNADTISEWLSWHRFDDMFYPVRSYNLKTGLGTHTELYDSLRVMCSQIGVELPVTPNANNYAQIFCAIRE